MAPPPPPPPPMCFPFKKSKQRRLSYDSEKESFRPSDHLARSNSFSPTNTITRADNLTFKTDTEKYDVPQTLPVLVRGSSDRKPELVRSNTMTGTKKSTSSSKWGYGWGSGRRKKEAEAEEEHALMSERQRSPQPNLPVYMPPTRTNSKSTQSSRSTQETKISQQSRSSHESRGTQRSHSTHVSSHRSGSHPSSSRSNTMPVGHRQDHWASNSSDTLIGSAFERKLGEVDNYRRIDSTERLEELRKLMAKDNLDYYIIPSEDAHQTEYVAESDKRRQFISGFTGTAGTAVVSKNSAYLITDSRYWLQAKDEIDSNWNLVPAGSLDGPKDWIDWMVDRASEHRIGIDARMISHEKATLINSKITHGPRASKLIFPSQNLIDLVWTDKPERSKEPIILQPIEYTGRETNLKLAEVREWIKQQPASTLSYSKAAPTPAQMQAGTLIASLSSIAYLLNLRGDDIPFNPLFHAYLFIGVDANSATLFVDLEKLKANGIEGYLQAHHIEVKPYNDIWNFLRRREWGEGKILISPQTSYMISLMLTHLRYTVAPSHVEQMLSVKNEVEIEGLRRAYTRDGASFVRFLAWIENKLQEGYDITEYEAASRLTEFRRKNKHYWGLAYDNISASGPNAALPHYVPTKSRARMIDRDTPYLNDSGGQYRDGTCDTTRTVHFGRPTPEQCEAFTRVLQGHIAIDSAIFPEGTSGTQLDVLARKALWKNGQNYLHGTGHGFGSFLSVHEGPQGFSSAVPLVPGHVITNEPGFYEPGQWGIRIESALAVRRFDADYKKMGDIWLSFERLTCVPIQTKMVKESMLSKEEKAWIKEHNQSCYARLAQYFKDRPEDKRALKWLKRESERGIGIAGGAMGMNIEWD